MRITSLFILSNTLDLSIVSKWYKWYIEKVFVSMGMRMRLYGSCIYAPWLLSRRLKRFVLSLYTFSVAMTLWPTRC